MKSKVITGNNKSFIQEELFFMTLKCHGKMNKNWIAVWKMIWGIWQIFTIGTLIGEILKRNWLVKLTEGIWRILTRALESLKNLNGLLLTKVNNVWAYKVQRSSIWWHWRLMQNVKANWLLLSKMTWRIWQIFTRRPDSLRAGTLMRFFYPK